MSVYRKDQTEYCEGKRGWFGKQIYQPLDQQTPPNPQPNKPGCDSWELLNYGDLDPTTYYLSIRFGWIRELNFFPALNEIGNTRSVVITYTTGDPSKAALQRINNRFNDIFLYREGGGGIWGVETHYNDPNSESYYDPFYQAYTKSRRGNIWSYSIAGTFVGKYSVPLITPLVGVKIERYNGSFWEITQDHENIQFRPGLIGATIFFYSGASPIELSPEDLAYANENCKIGKRPDQTENPTDPSETLETDQSLQDQKRSSKYVWNGSYKYVGEGVEFNIPQLAGYQIISATPIYCGCDVCECECDGCCVNKVEILKMMKRLINA